MAEFQSIFTGQEVDNTINKLRSWIVVDGTYPTVTISGITYAVIWKSIPVSGKACYGIGLHPTTGRPYEIYYNGSSYTATALDADTKVTSVDNHYTPTAASGSELTATLSGTAGAYAKDTEYTVLTGVKAQRDAKGHVTGITYTAQKIKDTNTTYSTATQSADGLMSSADKTKLEGIATGATKVTTDTVSGWGYTKNTGTVTSIATSGTGISGGTITSTGTITLDSSSAGNATANKVVIRNAAGSIQTEKLAVSSGTTTKATMQYNSTEDCIEFIFA